MAFLLLWALGLEDSRIPTFRLLLYKDLEASRAPLKDPQFLETVTSESTSISTIYISTCIYIRFKGSSSSFKEF